MKKLAILGSTGSIGVSTLAVVAANPERFAVVALAAGDNVERLSEQVRQFRPSLVSVRTAAGASRLRELLGAAAPEIQVGTEGIGAVARHPEAEMVVAAVVGSAGLEPTWQAIAAGKHVALANKETLVMAGPLVMRAVREKRVALLPVDSEHSAVMQSLAGHRREEVRRIVLTASGGPFREWPAARIAGATPDDALAHPTWRMGSKITIDSATLMNKGLEVIEAHWLFDQPPEKIDVVVHTESIVHSMVEFHDGQVVAQLGVPDMKGPISYALAYPERLPNSIQQLDLTKVSPLHFYEVDHDKFPCLRLASQALADSELGPAILNAANEVAVQAFLERRIGFNEIARTIVEVLNIVEGGKAEHLEAVLEVDRRAREKAVDVTKRLGRGKM
ncbi:MAG: 1-deoxy-D-xylulose-5-phosphate reductoisomerase [Myxococcales bacterium]|nr:1-deoxy-D-xylulose-5-phosphate reductoisomerase [Myxococcales bacterium]